MKAWYFEVAGALIGLALLVAAMWMWVPPQTCDVDSNDIATCFAK